VTAMYYLRACAKISVTILLAFLPISCVAKTVT